VNLRQGQLEDESSAPDTVLDGMGALNLGDEEDYGYFGTCFETPGIACGDTDSELQARPQILHSLDT
jgi:hypothetical protein